MNPSRVHLNMQPDSAPSPRRGRRAARSRATAQNTDQVGDAQPAASSSQVPGVWGGFFGGNQPQQESPLPGSSNATAANSPQVPGIFNGLFAGNQPQPVSPLPGPSNTTATSNNPWYNTGFDAFGNAIHNAFDANTTTSAGGASTPALAPFGLGLGLGFAPAEPPFDPRHSPTMEELEEDMLRYPGTSREWLDNRATYFSNEVRKARKAGRRGPVKDLVISAQELEDPNDRYSGSVYVDDPDRLEAGRRGQVKDFVDPYLQIHQQGQEGPEPRHTGTLNSDDLVDLAFNRPQRGREARHSAGAETEIPAHEITHDDEYEYIRRSHRRRSPSPSPSTSSSSSSTSSSLPISSSDENYQGALQTLNAIRRTFGEQLCVPLTRLHKNDLNSFDPESFVAVSRLTMGSSWAKYLCFGLNFMRATGIQPPSGTLNAESMRFFGEILEARNLTRSERIDLELVVEDLKEMFPEN